MDVDTRFVGEEPIEVAERPRHHQTWLTRQNTTRTNKERFGESGRVKRGNKLHWKKHAEAPNQVADAGHLHGKTQSAGLRRKRAMVAVGVVVLTACFEVACTTVESVATVTSLAANGGGIRAPFNAPDGMTLSSNVTTSMTHRASFGGSNDITSFTVAGANDVDGASPASVATIRGVSLAVNINGGVAWLNSSRTQTSLRCADSQPLQLHNVDARGLTVEVGRIQSASTTRAIDITASDDVAVSALQTLSIRSGSTTNSNVGVVATGTDASVVIDASLKLQMGAASMRLNVDTMSAAHKPDSFASQVVSQLCVCGTTSAMPGVVYVMPAALGCGDRTATGAYPGRDPCVF